MRINIKPLSLNSAYRGRRFATAELKAYKQFINYSLPINLLKIKKTDKLKLEITFGFSSSRSDLDNCCKCFQDALAESYGFNDMQIYEIVLHKEIVKKGKEFIEFLLHHKVN